MFAWKSEAFSEECITTSVISGRRFAPKLTLIYNERIWVKFRGNCLIRDDKTFTNTNAVNLFTVWELDTWSKELNTDSTPGLFNPSYTKLIDDLSVDVTLILKNESTKDLINAYGISSSAKYFVEDESQNYLVLQAVFKYFQTFTGSDKMFALKSRA